jgi:DNA-directed RNA polymerase subunit RPC12/RpoP
MGMRYLAFIPLGIALSLWCGVILVALIRGIGSRCPRCSSGKIRPSMHRGVVEKTLPRFIRPYRCIFCGRRFFASRSADYMGARRNRAIAH